MTASSSKPSPRRSDYRRPTPRFTNSKWCGTDPEFSQTRPPDLLEEKNLIELFARNVVLRADQPFAKFRDPVSQSWKSRSWQDSARDILAIATLLRDELGVAQGDRIAILSATRYEWMISDLAILAAGAVSVGIYHSIPRDEVGFILWDSDATIVFAENEEQAAKLRSIDSEPITMPATEQFPGGPIKCEVTRVFTFEKCGTHEKIESFAEALARSREPYKSMSAQDLSDSLRRMVEEVTRRDVATIVYTSGTTGAPKGVVQSHDNHLSMLDGAIASGLLGSGEDVFLYLPLAHSFARLIAYAIIAPGGNLIFPTVVDRMSSRFDAGQMLKDISESEPVLLPSVPRIFEKIMDSLLLAKQPSVSKKLASWAVRYHLKLSRRAETKKRLINPVARAKWRLARRLVKKVRIKIFGEKLAYAISGGAPISVEVMDFFNRIGVLILQGYGLTETTPAISANTTLFNKWGTVGRPFECNEVKIQQSDGEIIVRGGNIALGYWKRPIATEESWDTDGWFHTGDIGELDAEGYLKITDRKKDLIVSSGGKKIPPALLEGKAKNSPYISQCFVFGDRKPYLVALITLNAETVVPWANSQGLKSTAVKDVVQEGALRELIKKELDAVNSGLAPFEQIRKFLVLSEDFTIDNGLLSPTLKMKRKAITSKYESAIEQLYKSSEE